jgi:hypothetical protein
MIIGLVMPVGHPHADGVEMECATKMPKELHVGMPASIDHRFLRIQISAYFFIWRLREDDMIKRFRGAVVAKQCTFIKFNLNCRFEGVDEGQVIFAKTGQLPVALHPYGRVAHSRIFSAPLSVPVATVIALPLRRGNRSSQSATISAGAFTLNRIPQTDDLIDTHLFNIVQHRIKRYTVAMNIGNDRNSHRSFSHGPGRN